MDTDIMPIMYEICTIIPPIFYNHSSKFVQSFPCSVYGLMQKRQNWSLLAMEWCLFYIKPPK